MTRRTGSADLPLHCGRVPPWLAERMASLGAIITQAVVHHYGRDEFLQRLSHPFWFQSFGAVMGMDWHSSGITTSVIGALKRGLKPLQSELGIYVCGGRGKHSRRTPEELTAIGERTGIDGQALTRASRLVAKVDSAALQDGFEFYLHGFFVTDDGKWTVVQQGMNGEKRQARRYHCHSEHLSSFVDEPHSAIEGPIQGDIINLTDRRAENSRRDHDFEHCRGRVVSGLPVCQSAHRADQSDRCDLTNVALREVKTLGDGILVVHCAITAGVRPLGIAICAGLHTGEPLMLVTQVARVRSSFPAEGDLDVDLAHVCQRRRSRSGSDFGLFGQVFDLRTDRPQRIPSTLTRAGGLAITTTTRCSQMGRRGNLARGARPRRRAL
ncbi:DUF763 domain-containing protein [Bradyrhizobium sp. TZ2]